MAYDSKKENGYNKMRPIWGILHKTHAFDFPNFSSFVQNFRGEIASRDMTLHNSISTTGTRRCMFH
jgi:hypothetical protein